MVKKYKNFEVSYSYKSYPKGGYEKGYRNDTCKCKKPITKDTFLNWFELASVPKKEFNQFFNSNEGKMSVKDKKAMEKTIRDRNEIKKNKCKCIGNGQTKWTEDWSLDKFW